MARTKEQDRARKRKQKEEANEIGKIPKCKNPKRREACRKSLRLFLQTYCMGDAGFLRTPPSERMGEIIDRLQETVTNGGRTHIRMARAHGKTSLVKGATVYALAYGFRRFVVCVAARRGDASSIAEDIWTLLEYHETFKEDFPEICFPIAQLRGVLQRAHNQLHKGERTRIQKTAERIVLPTIKGSVSSGAVVVARGFSGAARGLVRGNMRPDLLLCDDLQTDKAARNPATVAQMDEVLEKSFMGLAGHSKQLATCMTSTPICPNDFSELYAQKTNWVTYTYPMLISEPRCWRSEKDLWQEYFTIRKDSIAAGEPEHVAANKFYEEHRAEMDEGGEVLNPDFYDETTELSGLQHAFNLRFANGEDAFAAEYQMHPVSKHAIFTITAPLVASRVQKGSMPFWVPPETVFTAAATDLNPSYAFSTSIVAFDKNQTGFVTHYGLFTSPPLPIPDNIPDKIRIQRLTQALVLHGKEIAGWCRTHGLVLNRYAIDAGGKQFEAVCNFARLSRSLCGLGVLPMVGRAGRNWNPNVRSRIADARNDTVLCADQSKGWKWLAFNADFWRETAQRAWLGEVGTPGSLSLFDGNGARHGEFAAQVAAEVLDYKISLQDGRTEYRWRSVGPKHDYGDTVTMCYALAGAAGISANGYIPPPKKVAKKVHKFKRGKWVK